MRRTCYGFEPSGHRFRPLDGWHGPDGDMVTRLFCTRCGRISVANTANNTALWNADLLPAESQVDLLTNLPARKSDA